MENYNTTKEALIATPLPVQTRTYKPVSHAELIDLSLGGIQKAGLTLEEEHYRSSKQGQIAMGRYTIGGMDDPTMKLQISWQNSYDKTLRLTFAVGAIVLVCGNGMVSSRSINCFRKKHMGEIQTFAPQTITEYINNASEFFHGIQMDRDEMQKVLISPTAAAELLGRLYFEEDVLESTQLGIIRKEMIHPSFDYGYPGTLWELYQHVTYAIGGIHPTRWMRDHIKAHEFFMNEIERQTPPMILSEFPVIPDNQLDLFEEIDKIVSQDTSEEVMMDEILEVASPDIAYTVIITSDDLELMDLIPGATKNYKYNVEAKNEPEARLKAIDAFDEIYLDLPIHDISIHLRTT